MMRPIALLVMTLPSAALARNQCNIPDDLPPAVLERVESRDVRAIQTTDYTLSLSWSPQHCRTSTDPLQCGREARFGFVLHGLWPEGAGRTWPQYCRPVAPLPATLVREAFCATPSVRLLQHEWQKHGSCITSDPQRYLRSALTLYRGLRWPDMARLSAERPGVARFTQAFAAANRGMRSEMLRVQLSNGGWLEEVRLCLDKRLRPARCPADTPGANSRQQVRVWLRR